MKRFLFWIALITFSATIPISAQNFTKIGSEEAPIQYIRGTGNNIGLFVKVDLQSQASIELGKSGDMHMCKVYNGGSARGGGQPMCMGFGMDDQGAGKLDTILSPFRVDPPEIEVSTINSPQGLYHELNLDAYRVVATTYGEAEEEANPFFQILPLYEYEFVVGEAPEELFIPSLCLDQNLPVTATSPVFEYTLEPVEDVANNTFVGIFRFDKHLEEEVLTQNIFLNDTSIRWTGSLSDAELSMLIVSFMEVDSTSLGDVFEGFYSVNHMHLPPSFAQWVVWAALGDQDETIFLEEFNKIRAEFSDLPPATEEELTPYYHINHLVFHFAGMGDLQSKFRSPGSLNTLPVQNLDPIALIKAYPELYAEQNELTGIELSASESFDPDGTIESYEWSIEHHTLEGATINAPFLFESTTETPVILTVTDNSGDINRDTLFVPYTALIVPSAEEENNRLPWIQTVEVYPNPFKPFYYDFLPGRKNGIFGYFHL